MKKYGIRWRKKTWEQTLDQSKHKYGILILWGRTVPALVSGQFDYYNTHSTIPDKLHSVGIIFIIMGLIFQHTYFANNYPQI